MSADRTPPDGSLTITRIRRFGLFSLVSYVASEDAFCEFQRLGAGRRMRLNRFRASTLKGTTITRLVGPRPPWRVGETESLLAVINSGYAIGATITRA